MSSNCDKKDSNEVWYFAYGSNLYIPQMLARIGEWKASKKAQLRGWKLIFNVDSKRWRGGAANIIKTGRSGDVVYGVIYLISPQKLKVLTEYERTPKPPQDITVESEGEKIEAKAYIFRKDKPPSKPAPMYLETILNGLKQHCYGKDVIKAVRAHSGKNVRFSLFSKRSFEVLYPVALIEAYCFQSDFYANYDLLLRRRKRSINDVNEIGARIMRDQLSTCRGIIERYKDSQIFGFDLSAFLKLDNNTRKNRIHELSAAVEELVAVKGIGLSKATKILHTLYPQIIPIIDNNLKKVYRKLKTQWKYGDWNQLFMDYYDNFFVQDTYENLCRVHSNVSYLGLTEVRVFDILWWSYLKAERLREEQKVKWTTIS